MEQTPERPCCSTVEYSCTVAAVALYPFFHLIVERHDVLAGKGVSFVIRHSQELFCIPSMHTYAYIIHCIYIYYADETSFIDNGHDDGIQLTIQRKNTDRPDWVSNISRGPKKDTDMNINIITTKSLLARSQSQVNKTTNEKTSKICRFILPHLNCG